jgi:hypothetical protein
MASIGQSRDQPVLRSGSNQAEATNDRTNEGETVAAYCKFHLSHAVTLAQGHNLEKILETKRTYMWSCGTITTQPMCLWWDLSKCLPELNYGKIRSCLCSTSEISVQRTRSWGWYLANIYVLFTYISNCYYFGLQPSIYKTQILCLTFLLHLHFWRIFSEYEKLISDIEAQPSETVQMCWCLFYTRSIRGSN